MSGTVFALTGALLVTSMAVLAVTPGARILFQPECFLDVDAVEIIGERYSKDGVDALDICDVSLFQGRTFTYDLRGDYPHAYALMTACRDQADAPAERNDPDPMMRCSAAYISAVQWKPFEME